MQSEIVKIAKDRREKGQTVRTGYKKITIDGVEYKWDPTENGMVELPRGAQLPKN